MIQRTSELSYKDFESVSEFNALAHESLTTILPSKTISDMLTSPHNAKAKYIQLASIKGDRI